MPRSPLIAPTYLPSAKRSGSSGTISLRRCEVARDSSPEYNFLESGLEIIMKGIVVDTLDSVAPIPGSLSGLEVVVQEWHVFVALS
jgi:hypothetical protein